MNIALFNPYINMLSARFPPGNFRAAERRFVIRLVQCYFSFQIDHCRRTHDFDPFICTFLRMLAEQGQLAQLVEEHSAVKRHLVQSAGQKNLKKKSHKRRRR